MTTDVIEPRGGTMVESDFLKQLAAVIRAEDSYGQWDDKTDADLMAEFIVTRDERREIPIIGDPDPDVMWRLGKFYDAVGLLIEKRTGCMASQMQKMSHEGFGRIVLIAGKLVVVSKHLRDIHRFGFESWEKLAEGGDKVVAAAVETIEAYPDAARA
ncbi:NifX-associated nitrogen fixation protein [Pseudooceanicola nanhaiensis]|uniref:NifX-associated nitrogen fixation protein n=1 Tax=Pseudooceanicola nanhaiensis TaxID=375761 RepID=UPI001CD52955|nr:NifX-associated nitrogen fixation protein [Pseudooceanicola nanhaiensis]MCA0920179.1 NifX-associated nitrogen fixation protein [Pseudooceanicola nanhaiensis]